VLLRSEKRNTSCNTRRAVVRKYALGAIRDLIQTSECPLLYRHLVPRIQAVVLQAEWCYSIGQMVAPSASHTQQEGEACSCALPATVNTLDEAILTKANVLLADIKHHTLPFRAAAQYEGSVPGFVFKHGNQGMGYYWDEGYDTYVRPRMQDEDFIAASSFSGPRQGYVFKAGELGLGYYSDEGFSVYVQPFIRRFAPSSVFRGAVQGFVFKMDDCGIGYYTDLNNLVYVQLAPSGG